MFQLPPALCLCLRCLWHQHAFQCCVCACACPVRFVSSFFFFLTSDSAVQHACSYDVDYVLLSCLNGCCVEAGRCLLPFPSLSALPKFMRLRAYVHPLSWMEYLSLPQLSAFLSFSAVQRGTVSRVHIRCVCVCVCVLCTLLSCAPCSVPLPFLWLRGSLFLPPSLPFFFSLFSAASRMARCCGCEAPFLACLRCAWPPPSTQARLGCNAIGRLSPHVPLDAVCVLYGVEDWSFDSSQL